MGSFYNDGEDKKRVREEKGFAPTLPESMQKTRRLAVDHPLFSRLVGPTSPTLRVDESKKSNNVVTVNGGGDGSDCTATTTTIGGGGGVSEEVKEWVEEWMMGWDDVSTLTKWNYDEFEGYQNLVWGREDYKSDGEEIVWKFHDIWDLSLCQ